MDEAVKEKIRRALNRLFERDSYLIELDSFEPSITTKLYEYLNNEFSKHDVDHEYIVLSEELGMD